MREPLAYPWPDPPRTGLVTEHSFDTRPLRVPFAGRRLVIAVGSNSSPDVMRDKFRAAQVAIEFPIQQCTVVGLAVGHSAHVARGGYIPAAPYRRHGAKSFLTAGWFTPEQMDALDATEPNYSRITLPTTLFPVRLGGDTPPDRFDIYRGRHGVISLGGDAPVPLLGQPELWQRITATDAPVPPGDIHALTAALADSDEARTDLTEWLTTHATVNDGLTGAANLRA